jgi:hypothetical protein
VSLTIRPELVTQGADAFAEQVREYVRSTVRRVPCRFSFSAPELAAVSFVNDLGWIDREEEARKEIIEAILEDRRENDLPDGLLSTPAREAREERSEYWGAVEEEMARALVLEERKGALPGGLGAWRVYLCRFQIGGELLPAFFKLNGSDEQGCVVETLGSGLGLRFDGSREAAWNGMQIDLEGAIPGAPRGCYWEIDWCNDSAGSLAVSRNRLVAAEATVGAAEEVRDEIIKINADLALDLQNSPFYLLSARSIGADISEDVPKRWPQKTGSKLNALRSFEAPLINDPGIYGEILPPLRWRDADVTIMHPKSIGSYGVYRAEYSWYGNDIAPGYVAAFRMNGRFRILPVWDDEARFSRPPHYPPGFTASFPDEWKHMIGMRNRAGVRTAPLYVWNRDHPVIKGCTAEAWAWVLPNRRGNEDPLNLREELFDSPSRICAWLAHSLWRQNHLVWEGLIDRDESFLAELWSAVDGLAEKDSVMIWQDESGDWGELVVASPYDWSTFNRRRGSEKIQQLLPDPGTEWQILPAEDTAASS